MNVNTGSLRSLLDSTPCITINKSYIAATTALITVDSFITGGYPQQSSAVTVGSGSACNNATLGATPLPVQGSGEELRLLQVSVSSGVLGGVVLVDRLIATTGLNLSVTITDQPINTVALPRYADGSGVECFLYNTTAGAGGLAGQMVFISYTNQEGIAGRVATVLAMAGTVRAYACQKFALQDADTGVRSVQSISSSATGRTGNYGVVLIKRLVSIPLTPTVVSQALGGASLGFPVVHPDACLSYWMLTQGGAGAMQLDMKIASVAN